MPFWCPAGDAADVERGHVTTPQSPLHPILDKGNGIDPVPIARRLQEGDELTAGFVVLDTPGHSPGHVSFWRERDRVLVCADVFFNLSITTFRYGLRNPPGIFTVDPVQNRESQRRLAALRPEVVCFGHGPGAARPRCAAGFVGA